MFERTEIRNCPLCGHTFVHERPEVPSHALAGVFGSGTMQNVAAFQHAHRVEDDLRQHFETHTTEEWLRKVMELERGVAPGAAGWRDRFFEQEKITMMGLFRQIACGGDDFAKVRESIVRRRLIELDNRYEAARLAAEQQGEPQ